MTRGVLKPTPAACRQEPFRCGHRTRPPTGAAIFACTVLVTSFGCQSSNGGAQDGTAGDFTGGGGGAVAQGGSGGLAPVGGTGAGGTGHTPPTLEEVWAPAANTLPAQQGTTIVWANGWFWNTDVPTETLMTASDIVDDHLGYLEPRWVNFVLNCPPNPAGLLDDNIVQRLAEVGARWSPDLSRPPLPAQPAQNERPVTPVGASATSGYAPAAIDGINDSNDYTVWNLARASLKASRWISVSSKRTLGYCSTSQRMRSSPLRFRMVPSRPTQS